MTQEITTDSMLSEREERFAAAIAAGMTGPKAMIEAGYSDASTRNVRRLRRNEDIVARISELRLQRANTAVVDADFVLNSLRDIAVRCLDPATYDAAGATRALKLLGDHLQLFEGQQEGPRPILLPPGTTRDDLIALAYGPPTSRQVTLRDAETGDSAP